MKKSLKKKEIAKKSFRVVLHSFENSVNSPTIKPFSLLEVLERVILKGERDEFSHAKGIELKLYQQMQFSAI